MMGAAELVSVLLLFVCALFVAVVVAALAVVVRRAVERVARVVRVRRRHRAAMRYLDHTVARHATRERAR